MKPDIVFFGEGLPGEFHQAIETDRMQADLVIVMGSSLKVKPVAHIPNLVPPDIPQVRKGGGGVYSPQVRKGGGGRQ